MDYESIIKEIRSGLTGDKTKDLIYMKAQLAKYEGHELETEIVRECGRIIYDLLPEKQKQQLLHSMDDTNLMLDQYADSINDCIRKNDYEKALKIAEEMVKKVENMLDAGMFRNDSENEYYTFVHPFEHLLFRDQYKTDKNIRVATVPYSEIYLQYGSLLFEMKRIEEAREALAKAKRWNPVNAEVAFEYAELYKMGDAIDLFFEETIKMFSIVYTPEHLARCYRNLGFCFSEQKKWQDATICYLLSMQYDPSSEVAEEELRYIERMSGQKTEFPTMDAVKESVTRYGYPLGPDKKVLSIALTNGQYLLEKKQYHGARTLLTIVYRLTHAPKVQQMLNQIPADDPDAEQNPESGK